MKKKLKAQLRAMRAQWCDPDEIIVSLINFQNYSVLKWGIDNNYLETKPDGNRIGIYFKSQELLTELKQTTCAFSGAVIK